MEIRSGVLISMPPWALAKNPELRDEKHIHKVLEHSQFTVTEEMYSISWLSWFQLEQNSSRFLSSCCISGEAGLSNAGRREYDLNGDSLKTSSHHVAWCETMAAKRCDTWPREVEWISLEGLQKPCSLCHCSLFNPGSRVWSSLTVSTLAEVRPDTVFITFFPYT